MSVDGASTINVSATRNGYGGKAVVWADGHTQVAGTILANGGAAGGNGGSVETSGHTVDFADIRVGTSAAKGTSGTWLIDPTTLTIDAVAAATISGNLASTNVLVQTNADGSTSGPGVPSAGAGDIIVAANITWSSGNTLTLSAYHNIDIGVSDSTFASISNTGTGSLILRADNTGRGIGTVNFPSGQVDFSRSTGTVSIYYNPSCECNKYANPTNYSGSVFGNLTAYMLVNSAADLRLASAALATSALLLLASCRTATAPTPPATAAPAAPSAPPAAPAAHGPHTAMVVAANPLAANAGLEVLRRGGTAADAAVTVAAQDCPACMDANIDAE